ncbi:MAG: sel1 repeat family protein [Verrucomicrobiota bacterium]|nr:sel1 repeat family protein [Verrucomicrobiota bacterium]
MLIRLCLIGWVVVVGIIFAPGARAEDAAVDAIKKAIQVEREVTAYRIKESKTDLVQNIRETQITTEIVNPDQVHVIEEVNGELDRESLTDGKRLFVREGPQGELKEEARDAANKIKQLREDAMTSAPKPRDDVQLTGHETFDGVAVSVYTWKSFALYGITKTLRIADKDNRLIDERGEAKGEFPFLKQTIHVDASWHKTYEYDPSIKIALPAPVWPAPSPTAPAQSKTDQNPSDEVRAKAEAGDAEAQYLLGRRYARGQGATKDLAEAAKWYRKAADQNYAKAQDALGYYYEEGKGVEKDSVEAVKWYRKAADQNNPGGQYNLARCYAHGLGVPKDPVEAVKWYRKAAAQNFAMAQHNLGYCYDQGEGVPKDLVEAAKWYRKAAEQNQAASQESLGICYMNAEGVTKDVVEAYKWFLLASDQGEEQSKKLMALLDKQMSPEQLDEARKRAWANRIRALAMESNAALTSGNYARVADFVYPKVIEMMGGRDKMIETTRQAVEDMKDHGVTILGIEVSEPKRVVAANNKLFAVVPQVVRMEGAKKKGHANGFLIAVSEDAGKNWTFIDGAGLQETATLAQILPDFPAELSLPKKQPTVFEPK